MDVLLGLGKRSPPASSELLRRFFDVIPEPNKVASALNSQRLRLDSTLERATNHYFFLML